MPASRGTTSSTLSRAQKAMSSSSPGGPYVRALSAVERVGKASASSAAATAASVRSPLERLHDPAGAVGVVERERALVAGADDRHVLPALARRAHDGVEVEQAAEQDLVAALGRRDDRRASRSSSRGSASPRRGSRNSRGEAPTSKPSIRTASRSPPTTLSGSSARSARACSISGTQSTRRYPTASACAIVEVARITSTTIPVGAEAASSGVNATWTRIVARLDRMAETAQVLPAPRPGDGRLVLRVRPPICPDCMTFGPGRDPLSRPRAAWPQGGAEGRPEPCAAQLGGRQGTSRRR